MSFLPIFTQPIALFAQMRAGLGFCQEPGDAATLRYFLVACELIQGSASVDNGNLIGFDSISKIKINDAEACCPDYIGFVLPDFYAQNFVAMIDELNSFPLVFSEAASTHMEENDNWLVNKALLLQPGIERETGKISISPAFMSRVKQKA